MGLIVPVSGPYQGTWDGLVLGTQNDDGFVLTATYQAQEINSSDAYGMTLVEAIHRGINWKLRFKGLEFNQNGILSVIQAFNPPPLGGEIELNPLLGAIGELYSTYAKPLVLTAILPDPPTMPQTLTAVNAILAPQSNIEMLMTSKMREAPIEMVLLPYLETGSDSADAIAFSTT